MCGVPQLSSFPNVSNVLDLDRILLEDGAPAESEDVAARRAQGVDARGPVRVRVREELGGRSGARCVEEAVVEGAGELAEHVDDRVSRLRGGDV